jgi:CheY-like chemotaxis protein
MEPPRSFPQRPVSYGDLRGAIVLCVDNERTIIDGMKTLLSSWQCPVIAAMDSEEAIEQLKAARITPDIIISDYHLDREDGCEAIRAIAAMCNADVPGIIATADGTNEVRAKVVAEGYAFLQKPIKPAALRALISSLIVQHRAAE